MQCSGCGKDIPVGGSVCPYCGRDKSDDKSYEWSKIVFALLGGVIGYSFFDSFWGAAGCFFVGYIVGALFGGIFAYSKKSPPKVAASPRPAQLPTTDSVAEKLTQLKQLHDQGLLTAEEYARKKSDILARL